MAGVIGEEQRAILVHRISESLAMIPFHLLRAGDSVSLLTDEQARARAAQIDATAFAEYERAVAAGAGSAAAVRAYSKVAGEHILVALAACKRSSDSSAAEGPGVKVLDISAGSREFLTEERAKELFAPLEQGKDSTWRIKLGNKSFGLEAASLGASVLAAAKQRIVEADLSDIMAGRPEDEALQALTLLTDALEDSPLRLLDLSDNAFGEKGVRACTKLLKSLKTIEELAFQNNGISKEAAQAIAELVAPSKLRRLHFFNNMTGDAGAEHLAKVVKNAPLMEDFKLSSTRVFEEGCARIASALGSTTSLRSLDLSDNSMGPEVGAHTLAQTLSKQSKLDTLVLHDCALEDQGVELIALALRRGTPALRVLDLASNEVTSDGAEHIAALVEKLPALETLIVSENDIGNEGVKTIARSLVACKKLKRLEMNFVEATASAALFVAGVVKALPNFTLLQINGNAISERGVESLGQLLPDEKLGSLSDNDDEADDENDGAGDEADELAAIMQKMNV